VHSCVNQGRAGSHNYAGNGELHSGAGVVLSRSGGCVRPSPIRRLLNGSAREGERGRQWRWLADFGQSGVFR